MGLVVMKFGGSSVADADKIKNVARRVMETRDAGNKVVVVVSAPGDTTDDLIAWAEKITADPDDREMDMLLSTGEQMSIALLAMAIKDKGYKAVSLTGAQVGILTDKVHNMAKIVHIPTKKIRKELRKGNIVVVAGFQGITEDEDITTLGRGGSDLTAVALASVLKADVCEIFTDVLGVYTTDPRLVREARKLDVISYDEMLEMAGLGAQVMQARSIEVAKKFNIDIHVRSTFSHETGTIITREVSKMEDVVVRGIASDKNQAKISIIDLPDKPGVAASMFTELAAKGINVDMIIQSSAADGRNDISFTVSHKDLPKTLEVMDKIKRELGATEVIHDRNVAKISIVGVGMRSHVGIASKMFSALARAGINIEMISTSEIKISCVIKNINVEKAVKVIHKAFNLDKKKN
ncbi:MAG: aspartate kinase [bacterium]|nr:aspartate kinase [bacterium]